MSAKRRKSVNPQTILSPDKYWAYLQRDPTTVCTCCKRRMKRRPKKAAKRRPPPHSDKCVDCPAHYACLCPEAVHSYAEWFRIITEHKLTCPRKRKV